MNIRHQYYFLIAGLPELVFSDKKSPMNLAECRQLILNQLHPDDKALVQLLFLPFDHVNLINTLFHGNKAFNVNGVLGPSEIAGFIDAKLRDEQLPHLKFRYIADVLTSTFLLPEMLPLASFESLLLNGYYTYLASVPNKFVNNYSVFDKNIRNLFAALNGQKFSLPFESQLIGDDQNLEMLKKFRWRDYGMVAQVGNIEALLALFEMSDVLERELKIDMLRWHFIDDAVLFEPFSIDRVLAYLLKLMMLERWILLDHEKGKVLLAKFLDDIEDGIEKNEEFKMSHGISR
jgi:hypothetical protein